MSKEELGKKIIRMLYDAGMIETWYKDKADGWILVSGLWSPLYINLRPLASRPDSRKILTQVGSAMGKMIRENIPSINKLVGLYMAGIPLATAITMTTGIPSCYARNLPNIKSLEDFYREIGKLKKELEEHGQHKLVEGDLCDDDHVAIVDDLVTTFKTKLIARAQIYEAAKDRGVKINCEDVIVLIDREQGAKETASSLGMRLWSLIPFKSKGIEWLKDKMTPVEYEVIVEYFENPQKFQNPEVQNKLRVLAQRVLAQRRQNYR
jgi:orotate phosphoribosyltransferase